MQHDVRIPLTRGRVALADAEDAERLSLYHWAATGTKWTYASAAIPGVDGVRRRTMMHRFIMQPADGMVVDHIDGDCLNNRRSNLRVCTSAQNLWNAASRGGVSRFKGVFFDRGRPVSRPWRARLLVDRTVYNLGNHATEQEAAMAYDEAALRLHGEFARTNRDLGLYAA